MWKDNDKIMKLFDIVKENKSNFPCACPVCNSRSAHIYIHSHDEEHSGIWTWCSKCGVSSHMSSKTPMWWKNPDFIDEDELCSNPDYLNQRAEKIDEWVNSLLPHEITEESSPFIMEDKFKVCFKKGIKEISAGSTGILIIKNDFKNMKINFIDSSNNKINISLPPEELLQIVDIIK